MTKFSTQKGLLILYFYVAVPFLDQYTDFNMVTRLFRGPEDDVQIRSGRIWRKFLKEKWIYIIFLVLNFPSRQVFHGSFSDQKLFVKRGYQMVNVMIIINDRCKIYNLSGISVLWDHCNDTHFSGTSLFMCYLLQNW